MAGLIKNFGLYWDRNKVDWGRPGHGGSGSLTGYNARKYSEIVDFREQAGVYVLHEGATIATQQTTYVGQAGTGNQSLFQRLRAHRRDHLRNRWQRFSWFGLYKVGANEQLVHAKSEKKVSAGSVEHVMNHLEGLLISLLEPSLNKQGPRWGSVDEYIQQDLEDAGDVLEAVEQLADQVASLETQLGQAQGQETEKDGGAARSRTGARQRDASSPAKLTRLRQDMLGDAVAGLSFDEVVALAEKRKSTVYQYLRPGGDGRGRKTLYDIINENPIRRKRALRIINKKRSGS